MCFAGKIRLGKCQDWCDVQSTKMQVLNIPTFEFYVAINCRFCSCWSFTTWSFLGWRPGWRRPKLSGEAFDAVEIRVSWWFRWFKWELMLRCLIHSYVRSTNQIRTLLAFLNLSWACTFSVALVSCSIADSQMPSSLPVVHLVNRNTKDQGDSNDVTELYT